MSNLTIKQDWEKAQKGGSASTKIQKDWIKANQGAPTTPVSAPSVASIPVTQAPKQIRGGFEPIDAGPVTRVATPTAVPSYVPSPQSAEKIQAAFKQQQAEHALQLRKIEADLRGRKSGENSLGIDITKILQEQRNQLLKNPPSLDVIRKKVYAGDALDALTANEADEQAWMQYIANTTDDATLKLYQQDQTVRESLKGKLAPVINRERNYKTVQTSLDNMGIKDGAIRTALTAFANAWTGTEAAAETVGALADRSLSGGGSSKLKEEFDLKAPSATPEERLAAGAEKFAQTSYNRQRFVGDDVMKGFLFDVSQAVPDMLVSIGLGALTGGGATVGQMSLKSALKGMLKKETVEASLKALAAKMVVRPEMLPMGTKIFAQSYQSNVEEGMEDRKAFFVALINAYGQSLLEGGGAQKALREGNMNKLVDFVKASFGEGAEEIQQNWWEGAVNKLVGGKDIPVFSADPNAESVINPARDVYSGLVGMGAGAAGGSVALPGAVGNFVQEKTAPKVSYPDLRTSLAEYNKAVDKYEADKAAYEEEQKAEAARPEPNPADYSYTKPELRAATAHLMDDLVAMETNRLEEMALNAEDMNVVEQAWDALDALTPESIMKQVVDGTATPEIVAMVQKRALKENPQKILPVTSPFDKLKDLNLPKAEAPVAPEAPLTSPQIDTSKMSKTVLKALEAEMAGTDVDAVLDLALEGKSAPAIAKELGIAPKAVRATMLLSGVPKASSPVFSYWAATRKIGQATAEQRAELDKPVAQRIITPEAAQSKLDNVKVLRDAGATVAADLGHGAGQLQRLGKRLGVDVVFYNEGSKPIRGLYSTKEKDTLFINIADADTGEAAFSIMGHEFLHSITTNHKDLYKAMRDVVGDTLTPDKVKTLLKRYDGDPAYQQRLSEDSELLIEEMLADEAGSIFTDKTFWENLAKRDETLAQKLVRLLKNFINEVLAGGKVDSGNLGVLTELQLKEFRTKFEDATASIMKGADAAFAEQLQVNLGVSTAEAEMGAAALTDLNEKFSTRKVTKTIARDYTRKLLNDGYVDFAGKKITSTEELAVMSQLLRDPRFETFRYFFVNDDQEVVHFVGVSSRMPGVTPIHPKGKIHDFANKEFTYASRRGATGFYLMHNHPSGNPTASPQDIAVTKSLSKYIFNMTFLGHVIINSKQYTEIDADGNTSTYALDVPDAILKPDKPHGLLGMKLNSSDILAAAGKAMQATEGYSTLIYMTPRNEVRGLQEIPTEKIRNGAEFKRYLRENAREFGGARVAIVAETRSAFGFAEDLVRDGVIQDAVMTDGSTSIRGRGVSAGNESDWMGLTAGDVSTTAWEDSDKYSIRSLSASLGVTANRDGDGTVSFSRASLTKAEVKSSPQGRMIKHAVSKGYLTAAEADKQYQGLADFFNLLSRNDENLQMVYEFVGSDVFNAIKSNADPQYAVTIDFSAICKKTQSIIDAMSTKMVNEGKGMTLDEIITMYGDLHADGKQVPCPQCYVFSRWTSLGGLLDNIKSYQIEYADATPEKIENDIALSEALIGKYGKDKTSAQSKLSRSIDSLSAKILDGQGSASDEAQLAQLKQDLRTINAAPWLETARSAEGYKPVPDSILYDLNKGAEFASRYPETWKFRTTRGPAAGKQITPYTDAAIGEIIQGIRNLSTIEKGEANPFLDPNADLTDTLGRVELKVNAQNLIGGYRYQSFSDFRYEYGTDYLMAFLDLQNVGAMAQGYTKVIESVDFFAGAGATVNMSLISTAEGIENGEVTYSTVSGMDPVDAFGRRLMHRNAGTVLIGMFDAHIALALSDNRIDFIIPYHASGAREQTIADMMNAIGEQTAEGTTVDYSLVQGDKPNPAATPEQKLAGEIRIKLLTKPLSWEPTAEEAKIIKKSPYLMNIANTLRKKGSPFYGTALSTAQAKNIMPWEYWDKTVGYEDAFTNSNRFKEYAESVGVVPRFTGKIVKSGKVLEAGFGNILGMPFGWKTLIDRRMYDNAGEYFDQQKVNLSDVPFATLTPSVEKQSTRPDPTGTPSVEVVLEEKKAPVEYVGEAKAWYERLYTKIFDKNRKLIKTDFKTGMLASNTALVSGTTEHILTRALVDTEGNVVGDSWKEVTAPFVDDKDFWSYMAQRHNIDRAREGKPVDPNMSSEQSQAWVAEKDKEHPEYDAWAKSVTKWIDDFMFEWAVKPGLLDPEVYEEWRTMYPSYFPTYREFSDLESASNFGPGKRFVDLPSVSKKATGSSRDITNPVGNVMQMVNKVVRTARYNTVGQSLLDMVKANPDNPYAEIIPANIGMFQSKKVDNIVTVWEDGKPTYLQINNKELLEALNGLPKIMNNAILARKVSGLFKGLITQYNPLFALRNIFRDIPTAYVYGSQNNPLFFLANLGKAMAQIATKSEAFERYRALGGAGGGQFSADEASQYAKLLQPSASKNLVAKGFTSTLKMIEFINQLTEQAPRLSEFNHVLKKTGDVQQALYAAQNVTVNFARGGDVAKQIEPFVPYLNASLQGIDRFFDAFNIFKDPKGALARMAKAGIAVTTPQLASYLISMADDEEKYKALDQRTKDAYYVFPKPDGKTYWKIPKSRELGVLFGTLFERVLTENFEGFGGTVATNFTPVNPFENNLFAPFVFNIPSNKDFAGRAIVPESLQDYSPRYQYDDNTSEIAKTIGDKMNWSPKQVDYLIRSYTGVLGQLLLPATTKRAGAGTGLERVTIGAFTADPAFSSQAVTDFYDRLDEVTTRRKDAGGGKDPEYTALSGVASDLSKATKYINKNLKSSDPKVREIKETINKNIAKVLLAKTTADILKAKYNLAVDLYKLGVR